MVIYQGTTLTAALENFVITPFQSSEILTSVLPLVVGAIVIELYFGRYKQEELGWNTSVGNAVIWGTTGLNLLLTTEMNQNETLAAFSLLGLSLLIGYMDFFHKWPDTIAFVVSSSGIVYTLAYIVVVMAKTSMPVSTTSMKAAGILFVAVNIGFKLMQSMEPSRSNPGIR
jgi:uncharacterized membrane protein YecN with MAPEG domain